MQEILLPAHGGMVLSSGEGQPAQVGTYYFENLSPTNGAARRFRLLITPPIPGFTALRQVRLGTASFGHIILEVEDGPRFDLLPGDPELQLEVENGAVPNETRPNTVIVNDLAAYGDRTSQVLFEANE